MELGQLCWLRLSRYNPWTSKQNPKLYTMNRCLETYQPELILILCCLFECYKWPKKPQTCHHFPLLTNGFWGFKQVTNDWTPKNWESSVIKLTALQAFANSQQKYQKKGAWRKKRRKTVDTKMKNPSAQHLYLLCDRVLTPVLITISTSCTNSSCGHGTPNRGHRPQHINWCLQTATLVSTNRVRCVKVVRQAFPDLEHVIHK